MFKICSYFFRSSPSTQPTTISSSIIEAAKSGLNRGHEMADAIAAYRESRAGPKHSYTPDHKYFSMDYNKPSLMASLEMQLPSLTKGFYAFSDRLQPFRLSIYQGYKKASASLVRQSKSLPHTVVRSTSSIFSPIVSNASSIFSRVFSIPSRSLRRSPQTVKVQVLMNIEDDEMSQTRQTNQTNQISSRTAADDQPFTNLWDRLPLLLEELNKPATPIAAPRIEDGTVVYADQLSKVQGASL